MKEEVIPMSMERMFSILVFVNKWHEKKVRNTANIKLAIGPFKLFGIDLGSVCYEKKGKNNIHDQFHRKKIE